MKRFEKEQAVISSKVEAIWLMGLGDMITQRKEVMS
jgi:hypothetical protein